MLKFRGNYYEFGQHIGKSLVENNHDFAISIDNTVYRRQLKIYKKYHASDAWRRVRAARFLPYMKMVNFSSVATTTGCHACV